MKGLLTVLISVLAFSTSSAQMYNTISGVDYASSNTLFVSGYLGTIMQSTNVGQSWLIQSTGTTLDLLGISMGDLSNGIAVGGTNIYFPNGTGFLLRTQNGGTSWDYQASPNGRPLRSVKMVSASVGFIVGGTNGSVEQGNGTILKTVDGGQSWQIQNSGTTQALYAVDFFDENNGVAVGGLGTILRTDNSGQTWTTQATSTGLLYAVSYISANSVSAAGSNGRILRSNDGGRTWAAQQSSTSYELYGIDFADANTGVAVGYSGVAMRTTNGGASWTSLSISADNLLAVRFRDASTGIIVGGRGTILLTSNGGATWTVPTGGTSGGTLPAVPTLTSPTNGATNQPTTVTLSWSTSVGAFTYRLQVSTNSAFTSTVVDVGSLGTTSRSVGPLANAMTYYWRVSATNDVGTSAYSSVWSFSTVSSSVPMFAVNPASISFGLVSTGTTRKDSVTVTNNGGGQLNITNVKSSNSVFGVSPTSATVPPGTSKKFYITFTPKNKNLQTGQISFTHNAAGSPSVVTVSGTGAPKGVAKEGVTDFSQVIVAQNYPNPFNPTTSIGYYLPEESKVQLAIFNILGQEVTTLVNGLEPMGYQEVRWSARSDNGETLPSGIYIFRLEATSVSTGEVSIRTGRMQLLK